MEPAERSHPGFEALEGFLRGRLPRSQVAAVVRHLLTGCPRCVAETRRLWSLAERTPRALLVLVGGAGRGAVRRRSQALTEPIAMPGRGRR